MASIGSILTRSLAHPPAVKPKINTSSISVELPSASATRPVNFARAAMPDITPADVAKIPKNYPANLPAASKPVPLADMANDYLSNGVKLREVLGRLRNTATSGWVWPTATVAGAAAAMPKDRAVSMPAVTQDEVQNFRKAIPSHDPLAPERQLEAANGDFTNPGWAGGEGHNRQVKSAGVLAAVIMLNRYQKVAASSLGQVLTRSLAGASKELRPKSLLQNAITPPFINTKTLDFLADAQSKARGHLPGNTDYPLTVSAIKNIAVPTVAGLGVDTALYTGTKLIPNGPEKK